MYPNRKILLRFHRIREGEFKVTSPEDPKYNCVAWVFNDTDRWWDPDPMLLYYWPDGIKREYSIEAFGGLFITLGYEACDNAKLEDGFEKVAIYVDDSGIPTHVARQLSSGRWTSKLGNWEDIEHNLDGLEGSGTAYGRVAQVFKRRKKAHKSGREE